MPALDFYLEKGVPLEEAKKRVLEDVYGVGFKLDRHGRPIEQGIGSLGHETDAHYAALEKYFWQGGRGHRLAPKWRPRKSRLSMITMNSPAPPLVVKAELELLRHLLAIFADPDKTKRRLEESTAAAEAMKSQRRRRTRHADKASQLAAVRIEHERNSRKRRLFMTRC